MCIRDSRCPSRIQRFTVGIVTWHAAAICPVVRNRIPSPCLCVWKLLESAPEARGALEVRHGLLPRLTPDHVPEGEPAHVVLGEVDAAEDARHGGGLGGLGER